MATIKLYRSGSVYTFTDVDIIQGTLKDNRSNALVADNLAIDTLRFTIKGRKSSKDGLRDNAHILLFDNAHSLLRAYDLAYADVDFLSYTRFSDYVEVYNGSTFCGKYYVDSVIGAGNNTGAIEYQCVSLIGILDAQPYRGNVYSTNVGNVIADIMQGFTYSIENTFATSTLKGWIPPGSKRDALKQILFQAGASIVKDSGGDITFTYVMPQVTAERYLTAYIGGTAKQNSEAASKVRLIEHSFFASAQVDSVVVFDNTADMAADHYEVIFDSPHHTFTAEGLTLHESGANYAIVSGMGVLKAKPYIHSKRVLEKATQAAAVSNTISYDNAYCVNPLNSLNCLERLAGYYGQSKEIETSIKVVNPRPGNYIEVPDPTNYAQTVKGYIKSIKRTFSKVVKGDVVLTSDWQPSSWGNNFNNYALITQNGNWTVPAGTTKIRIHVIAGGTGGASGTNGGRGSNGQQSSDRRFGDNGSAGQHGNGGNGGKVYITDLDVTPGQTYAVTVGAGGLGGTPGSSGTTTSIPGSDGGETKFGNYSSNNGQVSQTGIANLFTGEIYALSGNAGVDGAGGDQAVLEYMGVEYRYAGSGEDDSIDRVVAEGAAGGNPAAGDTGQKGYNGDVYKYYNPVRYTARGGTGGRGGNAIAPPNASGIGSGGIGGNGGGGGGAGGWVHGPYGYDVTYTVGAGGAGGTGSAGGLAAPGGVLIYY